MFVEQWFRYIGFWDEEESAIRLPPMLRKRVWDEREARSGFGMKGKRDRCFGMKGKARSVFGIKGKRDRCLG